MSDKRTLQKNLIDYIIHDVMNAVDEEDVLKVVSPNVIYYKGKQLNEQDVLNLKKECETFKDSTLWKILSSEVRYHAKMRMYERSANEEDILAGKLMLYVIQLIDNKLNEITR